MLQVSGLLNKRMYGPSSRPKLPEGLSKRYAWQPGENEKDRYRRSIYVFAKRNMRFPLFDAFDRPDMHSSCGNRSTTTTAPQALLMLNSEDTQSWAHHWAVQLDERHGDNVSDLLQEAYTAAWGRPPDGDKIATAKEFISRQLSEITTGQADLDPPLARQEALSDFCHALLNANAFMYID